MRARGARGETGEGSQACWVMLNYFRSHERDTCPLWQISPTQRAAHTVVSTGDTRPLLSPQKTHQDLKALQQTADMQTRIVHTCKVLCHATPTRVKRRGACVWQQPPRLCVARPQQGTCLATWHGLCAAIAVRRPHCPSLFFLPQSHCQGPWQHGAIACTGNHAGTWVARPGCWLCKVTQPLSSAQIQRQMEVVHDENTSCPALT